MCVHISIELNGEIAWKINDKQTKFNIMYKEFNIIRKKNGLSNRKKNSYCQR